MYANAESLAPLPTVLDRLPMPGPSRRHQIGAFHLDGGRLERFNRLLAGLGRPRALDCDQIVTAARCLLDDVPAPAEPDCIGQRLRRAAPLAGLLADGGWLEDNAALPVVRTVHEYVQREDDLIPDWVPRVGRLDDAIVIDAAWPRIAGEVLDYLDFCRLRRLEAAMRGVATTDFRYDRRDWHESRRGEAALKLQQRRVREGSYAPAAVLHFRVH